MKNIDYDAYLKTIPDLATSQKDIIRKYLEEQCEKDEALKALYKPSHIDGCYNFILECVRKSVTGGRNAVVEDAVVFKMARDYFIEILPKLDEGLSTLDEIIPKAEAETPEVKPEEVEAVKETVEEVAEQIKEDAAEDPHIHGASIAWSEEVEAPAELQPTEDKYAELKKAMSFGKTIQYKLDGEWVDWEKPTFDDDITEYRIKPEEEQPEEKSEEVLYDDEGQGMLFSF